VSREAGLRGRLALARVAGLVAFAVLAGRAAHLAVAYERSDGLQERQVLTRLRLAPERGAVVDREGRELAVTVPAPSVYVVPEAVQDLDASARALARALDRDADAVRRRLEGRRGFTFVARWVDPARAERVEALDLPGVGVVREPRRAYPGGELAGPVLGFANIDGHGARGVEQKEDAWLRGRPRVVGVERDGSGRLLARAGVAPLDAAGGDVALTLDARLQSEAEAALRETVRETRARGGMVVTLDPRSGAILALAQAPGFDPNRFRDTAFAQTRCRAFTDAVEPGSTLKAFLVAAALEADAVGPDQALDTGGGELRIPGKTVRDRRDFGPLGPADVLRVSSNVGAVLIARELGARRHFAALRRFGFGEPTASGFPGESAGLLRDAENWRPVDQAAAAYGQGLGVTAVQLAAAAAALARDGSVPTPHLVRARRAPRGSWQPAAPGPARRAVSPQTAARVRRMLETVVSSEGTGRLAGLAGVPVAGKTGTAQKLDPETGRYSHSRYRAWFVGIVPADDPQLVIVTEVDEPQGPRHSGGSVAAPLFARVAAAQLGLLGRPTRPAPLPAAPAPPEPPEREDRAAPETLVAAAPTAESVPSAGPPAERPAEPAAGDAGNRAPDGTVEAGHGDATPVSAPGETAVAAVPAGGSGRAGVEIIRYGDRVLLPDFRGLTLQEVMRITSQHAVELQFRGQGRAVEQEPLPGTIVAGDHPRVWVRFAHARMGEG